MSENSVERDQRTMPRSLLLSAWANVALWLLSMVAFVVVLQKDSPRGLFVLLAVGLMTSLAHAAAVKKRA